MTNVERITHIMEHGSPLKQAVVVEAVIKYTDLVEQNKEILREQMKDGLVDFDAWLSACREVNKEMKEQYA